MKPIAREEVLDWQTWSDERPGALPGILEAKRLRRVHVGDHLTFLFENRDTLRYQVHEMLRAERMVREKDIVHEIETYNELLGADGELGCTLLIEIDDPAERDVKLRAWLALPEHLYAELDDGTRVRPRVDERQRSDRLSAVQYLKFDTQGRVPRALGCDLPGLSLATELAPETRAALAADLAPDPAEET